MTAQRPRLLAIGDAAHHTGYGRVLRHILGAVHDRFEISQLAVNYFGDPHPLPWALYAAGAGGGSFGFHRVAPLLTRLRPDLVVALADLPHLGTYYRQVRTTAPTVPFVGYCPVESSPLHPPHAASLSGMDRLALYTETSRSTLLEAFGRAETQGELVAPATEVIPHGVDASTFHPLEPDDPDRDAVRRRAKARLFRGDEEHSRSFIVLNANRNQPRKRIDLTIAGFARFARGKDRFVKLYLHMGRTDRGWSIVDLARRHGIYDRLIVTCEGAGPPESTDEELNLIYNACEVGINTSAAEGWGLVSFEHAATGAAQVVPNHGNCAELWDGVAELVDPCVSLTDPRSGLDHAILHPDEVARALERLYRDRDHRDAVAARCLAHAKRAELRWDAIEARWRELLDLDELRRSRQA